MELIVAIALTLRRRFSACGNVRLFPRETNFRWEFSIFFLSLFLLFPLPLPLVFLFRYEARSRLRGFLGSSVCLSSDFCPLRQSCSLRGSVQSVLDCWRLLSVARVRLERLICNFSLSRGSPPNSDLRLGTFGDFNDFILKI